MFAVSVFGHLFLLGAGEGTEGVLKRGTEAVLR